MRDDGEHYTITATVKNEAVPCMRFCRSMCVTMNQNSRCATTAFVRLRRFHSVQMRRVTSRSPCPKAALEIVDDTGTRRVDSRSFTFFVGTSQPDDRSAELLGTRPVAVELKL